MSKVSSLVFTVSNLLLVPAKPDIEFFILSNSILVPVKRLFITVLLFVISAFIFLPLISNL